MRAEGSSSSSVSQKSPAAHKKTIEYIQRAQSAKVMSMSAYATKTAASTESAPS